MGLVHIPRTLAAISKAFLRRQIKGEVHEGARLAGVGPENPHFYHGRVGLFDFDYLGHMNNAAFLSHAELARWDMMTYNGLLSTLYKHNVHYFVAGAHVRYRQEIRPLFRQFVVESHVAALDSRNIWIFQNFRSDEQSRIMAQIVVQGVMVQKGKVLDPAEALAETADVDAEIVKRLTVPLDKKGNDTTNAIAETYGSLEAALRSAASKDDDQ